MKGLNSIWGKLNVFVFKGSAQMNGPKTTKPLKEITNRVQSRPSSLKPMRAGLKTVGNLLDSGNGFVPWRVGFIYKQGVVRAGKQ